ncbi:uncharacterized protein LOC123564206 [Mercenaria mercenaria]|uniref:uncharacterized protein LOC123564206 n=1 Tax=Mercenaria mercenaria TaxID=6596 RepID=UPI00234E9020|nr:uncharacterized protein LOC123564206 [Mercenaria mercenaria]
MVNIIMCGPAGAGKTTLIENISKKCIRQLKGITDIVNVASRVLSEHGIHSREDYRCNDRNYIDVNRDIIQSQCSEERNLDGQDFITDNCVINVLVLLEKCVGVDVVETILEMKEVGETIERYKRSLVVFLWPVQYEHDDGMCLSISQDQWPEFRETYLKFFRRFQIPFLELKLPDIAERISAIKEAIDGKLPLESSTLQNYDPKMKDEDRIVPSHFLFHLKKAKKENCIAIPTIEITEHFAKQTWTDYTKGETSRFIVREGHDHLICLKFDISVKATFVQKMLLGGLFVNGCQYSFLGCSASGLKSRKCFMYQGNARDVEQILLRHGDFSSIRTVSKRLARIGLLFSGIFPTTVTVAEEDITEKNDITTGETGLNFTDGCGGLGKAIAQQLASSSGTDITSNYIPSVFQIRLQGYKGVLALAVDIPEKAIMVRPSMKKFDTKEHPYIGICGHSKPYTFGHLNKQFIILLSGLGIRNSIFEIKQAEYLETIRNMLTDSESAIRILLWQNMVDFAQDINKAGCIENMSDMKKAKLKQELKRLQSSLVSKAEKLDILIPQSRNIFGVCDQAAVLDYGQCFLRLTVSDKPKTIRGQVVVCKNPCYLLGDVRVLTAIDETDNPDVRKLHHLVDCIVFPTRGKRPHPNEIAGSDLDGDRYFVTWDEQLIPGSVRPPYDYPGTNTKPEGTITEEKIIAYFARQNETQKLVGRVDKYYNRWANIKGPTSTECERLGQLFSKVIDSSKTGEAVEIPRGLQPRDEDNEEDSDLPKFVWNKMYRKAKAFKEEFTLSVVGVAYMNELAFRHEKVIYQREGGIPVGEPEDRCDISEDFIYDFAQQTYSNVSEYEKFRFLLNYECRLGLPEEDTLELLMEDFSEHINFSLFSVEERKHALELGIPTKILLNALNSSKIISEDELNFFQMDSSVNTWQKYVSLEHNCFDWSYLLKALTTNDNNLLLFKMPDGVILELQIVEKLTIGTEQPVTPGTITGLFYSKHFGYKIKYILGKEYVLDLTGDTFQLYRDCKKNLTFVWLNATDRKQVKRHWNKRVCDEVRNALSVDLQRFNRRILDQSRKHPLINKMPFVMIELYAQNCNGEIPYWDIYDANDMLPVAEELPEEPEGGSDFDVDFKSAFPKAETDIDAESDEEFCEKLKNIAASGNPYAFKSLLDRWSPKRIPNESVFSLIEMLNNFISKVVPMPLPEEIKLVLMDITVIMSEILNAPAPLLSVLSLLTRLGLNDLKIQLLQKSLVHVSQEEYLEVFDDWHSFVFLDLKSAFTFVEQLFISWATSAEEDWDQADGKACLQLYVRNMSILHLRDQADGKACLQLYVRNMSILHLMNLIFELHEHTIEYDTDRKPPPNKQTCITFLKVDTTAENEPTVVHFYKTGAVAQSASRFKGQYVMISKQNKKQVICTGQIETLNTAPCTISVKIIGNIPDILLHSMTSEKVQYWRIDLIGNIVMYQRVVSAFKNIISRTEINEIFTHIVLSCDFIPTKIRSADYEKQSNFEAREELNSSQNDAVKYALSKNVSMIQGPPGTGKTEVACQIIRHVVEMKLYNGILVVAETNVAVDNLTRRLRNHVSVVRVGPIEGVENDLFDVSLEGQVAVIAEREARRAKVRDQQGNIYNNTKLINRVLSAADVILTTCAGAGDVRLDNYKFPFVLVDEATQTLETTLLCSLVHGAEHLVLIGDPNQLGPVVKECPKECHSPNLPDVGGLSETLFHRWFRKGSIPVAFLDIQHRMHPAIMEFPSGEFYDNKLKAASSVTQRLPIVFPWPTDKPVCFIDVNGMERKCGTSFYNTDETDIVGKVVDVLLSVDEEAYRENRLSTHQIGIITLYQGQVQKMKEKIQNVIKISTVDGFQGQERDIIVVSTVRCNANNSLGFSDDTRRLNVLLTRAKRGLVVVGNKTTLLSSQIWTRWLQNAPELHKEAIKPVNVATKQDKRRGARGSPKKPTRNK